MSDTETTQDPGAKWASRVVDEIPATKRASTQGQERNTEFKDLYRWITSQPVGTKVLFKEGVHSPSYGGDKAKERFPLVRVSARQVGESTYIGRGGVEKTGPEYNLYVKHVGPNPTAADEQEGEADPPGDGLLD